MKKADKPADKMARVDAVLKRSRELAARCKQAEPANPYEQYRQLQKSDPVAAGEYWRANKDAITNLSRADFSKLTPAQKSAHCLDGGRIK